MARCLWCGEDGAYIGLNEIECPNRECRVYVPDRTRRKAKVVWEVNGLSGESRWLTLEEAESRVKRGNERYGIGTHWVEDGDIEWIFSID